MVTSATFWQRNLHRFVGMMRGERNTCYSERNGVFHKKIDYKSQATAAKSALRLGEKQNRKFDAYQCWFCNGWHIGSAANLTFTKFWSIMWVWITGKTRSVRKARMKWKEYQTMAKCERCGNDTPVTIMSMFNTQSICMECKEAEQQRPDYKEAEQADINAIKSGNYNFKGIGLK